MGSFEFGQEKHCENARPFARPTVNQDRAETRFQTNLVLLDNVVSIIAGASLKALIGDLLEPETSNIPRCSLFGITNPKLEMIETVILDSSGRLKPIGKGTSRDEKRQQQKEREKRSFVVLNRSGVQRDENLDETC